MAPGMDVRANSPLFEALERRLLLSATEEALGGAPLLLNDDLDFGDAPDSAVAIGYPTLLLSNGARHLIQGSWLGGPNGVPDGEQDGQPHPNALGDDNAGIDDEDGVSIPILVPGSPATIQIEVSGGGGFVRGWIDWNHNSKWDDPVELVVNTWLDDGVHNLNVPVPMDMPLGRTFARFRISDREDLPPEGPADNGEVEDHEVYVEDGGADIWDFGDAPDPTYPTLLASNGARHVIGGPWLGDNSDNPDVEPDGQPDPMAQGDDTDGNDDEDGVRIPVLSPNRPATIWVQVNGGGGQLDAWLDWHADGTFDEPGDRIFSGVLPNGVHAINLPARPDAALGQTFARFRINTLNSLPPEGPAQDGEVEDYPVRVRPTTIEPDWYDWSAGLLVLHTPDAEPEAIPLAGHAAQDVFFEGMYEGAAEDDDGNGTEEVETEIVELSLTGEGLTGPIQLRMRDGEGASGLMEETENHRDRILDVGPFGGDGTWAIDSFFDITYEIELPDGRVLHADRPAHLEGVFRRKFALPGELYVSVQQVMLLNENNEPTGITAVLERFIPNADEEMDFGDAPYSPDMGGYPTLAIHNGARHLIGGPWLGDRTDSPDGERDGQPEPNALGDDQDITEAIPNDDEDGVQIPVLMLGATSTIQYEVNGGGGVVEGWIDWNQDRKWDLSEQVLGTGVLPNGTYTHNVTPPAHALVGQTFARFRISRQGTGSPEGPWDNGEVEDHEVYVQEGQEELDFGDAPYDPAMGGYPTLLAQNGARHLIGGPWLGDNRDKPDAEGDGQPENLVPSDDNDGNDDENGVTIPVMVQGLVTHVQYEVNGGGGFVEAWIDWNGDWKWDASEQILATGFLAPGVYNVGVVAPFGSILGQTFARFRISGQRLMTPEGFIDNGEVEDHEVFIEEGEPLDFGDAPTDAAGLNYPTLLMGDGARHVIGGPWLGDVRDNPDPEPNGQPDPNAMGDDTDGNDDEDGAQIPILIQGIADNIKVEVNSASGGGGVVEVWVDWNGDWDWDHASEQIFAGWLPDGSHNIPVTAPFGSTLGQTFARFRISHNGGLLPTGLADNGEVEDHEVLIEEGERLDWGDAPDAAGAMGYPTLAIHNGANHVIGGPWLGDLSDFPDAEPDGQPDPNAMGDDNDGNDDEDGAQIPLLIQGIADNIKVEVNSTSGGGGVVEVWVDWNGDGTWAHPGEQIFSGHLPDGFHNIPVTAPFGSVLGQTFARFRISHNGGLLPTGYADNGEVEDHEVFIEEGEPLDFGDAPTDVSGTKYPTLLIGNGARHVIGGPWLGDARDNPDAEPDGQPDPNALGDDNDGNDDENGVQIPILMQGTTSAIQYEVNGGGGVVEAWIDWNGDMQWDASEQVLAISRLDGVYTHNVTPPAGAVVGQTFARYRISRQGGLSWDGLAFDGEVEDHEVFIEEGQIDFGDAPEPAGFLGYPTTLAKNGARHVIGGPWLGDLSDNPDAEPDGQPDPAAMGDDNDGNDDEDGVQIPILMQGTTSTIQFEINGVGAGVSGVVEAWFDWNGDKQWDASEWVLATAMLMVNGVYTHNVTPPAGAVLGQTFARYRISDNGTSSPVGLAPDGEVEDYEVFIEEGRIDFGDAPEHVGAAGYPTTLVNNGARHVIGGPWLGDNTDNPDPEPNGQPDPNAMGDDNDGNDDEDGVHLPAFQLGQTVPVSFEVNGIAPGTTAVVEGWFDWNGDRIWQPGELEIGGSFGPGMQMVPVTVPSSAVLGQTFARFRISINGTGSPVGLAPDGEVEDHELFIEEMPTEDFGDAPDSAFVPGYPTLLISNGARHTIDLSGPWLGGGMFGPDGELNGQPDPNALGDDNDGGDDEDGVTIPILQQGITSGIGITVHGGGGGGGFVDAWIDWNGNKQWEASEQIHSAWLAHGTHTITVTPSASSVVGQTFARFRISRQGGLLPTGLARDGEVEDYELFIEEGQFDFGDAPELVTGMGYPTTLALNGAHHVIAGPWLGDGTDSPDAEPNGQPDPAAMGDDNDGNDDEDGVNIPILQIGASSTITVHVHSGSGSVAGGFVEAWIDWNGNMQWEGSELIFAGPLPPGSHPINVTPPAGSTVGQTFARFRISSQGIGSPVGLAPDGEVEDHEVFIEEGERLDFGDAPDHPQLPGYPTLLAHNGARHVIRGPWMGDVRDNPDGETDGQPNATATGDDLLDFNDDEDGVQIPTLMQGRPDKIRVEIDDGGTGLGGAFLDAWIDWNGNRAWEPGEQIHAGFLPSGINFIPVTPPAGAVTGRTFARFRVSTHGGLAPTGLADDGEVEDHILEVTDAPPQVVNVYVSGSAWVAAFLNHIQALGLGSSTYGYSIPVGSSDQLDTLPWVNLDQLSIAFSEPVNVTMADLGVYGVHVASYSFSGFAQSAAGRVATWTFTSDMDNDKYLIDLSDAVTDLMGNQLDGEWTQTVSTYPSGDFVAGTDFRFRYNVLPGDVDQSGDVRASDTIKVRRKSNTVPGDPDYDIFYDVDGSGEIRASDTIKVRRRTNTSLPTGEPTAPPSVLSAGLIAAALEAMEDDSDSLDVLALTSTIPAPLAP